MFTCVEVMTHAGRKPYGSIPAEVRPHLPRLLHGMEEAGVNITKACDGIAYAFGVTRSTVWKAAKLRAEGVT